MLGSLALAAFGILVIISIAVGASAVFYVFLSCGLMIWGIYKLVTRYEQHDVYWGIGLMLLSIALCGNASHFPQWGPQ